MMLKDLLIKNRSIRSFVPGKKIDRETLVSFVELCRYTPSSANLQALKFAVVYGDSEVKKVFDATKWAGYLSNETIPPTGHEPSAFIVICIDKTISSNTTMFFKDTGICAQSIMLGAAECGIGGCMIGSFKEEEIKAALGIGDEMEISLVIALGYPDETSVIVDYTDSIKYYRQNGIHYVPKRSLDEILIK